MSSSGDAGLEAVSCLKLSALSIITDAKEADLDRTRFCGVASVGSESTVSSVSFFLECCCLFAALPRASSANTAAGFFFDLSSSEDLDDDMIVSRVPYAADLVRLAPHLLTCR